MTQKACPIHQYIDRKSGEVRTEKLVADALVRRLYSSVRERAPALFRAAVSRRASSLLGALNYDAPLSLRLSSPSRMMRALGIDLRELRDAPETLDRIVECMARLETLGRGVVRYGCPLAAYLDTHKRETQELPKFLARIRTGNSETFEYLFSDDERLSFFARMEVEDVTAVTNIREVSGEDGRTVQQRVSVYEIYEAGQMTKILRQLAELGLDVNQFAASEEPRYELIEGEADGNGEAKRYPLCSMLELIAKIRELGRRGLTISRYKGLGEMNPKQLFETTMDPATRRFLKVTIEDAAEANRVFTMLMGDDVPPRRQFIEDNALNTSYLDV